MGGQGLAGSAQCCQLSCVSTGLGWCASPWAVLVSVGASPCPSHWQVHDYLRSKLCSLYENDCIFDKFECVWNGSDR